MVNSAVLVFVAGALMGFSRICGSPEMVIIGRFITGIHSGKETHIRILVHKVRLHIYILFVAQLQVSPQGNNFYQCI